MCPEETPATSPTFDAETAFLVYRKEGHWLAAPDLSQFSDMTLERSADFDDMFIGTAIVNRDISATQVAAHIMAAQQEAVSQVLNQQRTQEMVQKVLSAKS